MTDPAHLGPSYGELLLRGLRHPTAAPALESGGRAIPRGEALARVYQVARWVRTMVPDPEGGIAAVTSNRPELFYLWAGAAVAGRRFTALHPYSSAGDHQSVLQDADPAMVVVDQESAVRLDGVLNASGDVVIRSLEPVRGLVDATTVLSRTSTDPVRPEASPDSIVSLAYTGGSTGSPKGVMRSDRAMAAATTGALADWDWPAHPRLLVVNPMTHGSSIMLAPTLLRGGTIVIEPGFEAATFSVIVARTRATITFLVPTMVKRLLAAVAEEPARFAPDLSTLETIVYGGAPMPEAVRRAAVATFGPVMMQIYGQVEAPMQIAVLSRADHVDPVVPAGAVGRPVSSVQVSIRGADGGRLAESEEGEICVQGPVVMSGYWRRRDDTKRALRGGALWTGDLGFVDEAGYLHIVGRSKEMIISGGVNVYMAEVEAALSSHSCVAEAAAWGVPDEEWGERLAAAVVLHAGSRVDKTDLREHVRAQKGSIQTPKDLLILDRLPTTAVGKVDKSELGRMLCGSRTGAPRSETPGGYS